jgi:thiosulfate sulfurtransferase
MRTPNTPASLGTWLRWAQAQRQFYFSHKEQCMTSIQGTSNMTIAELAQWRAQEKPHTLLDVRRDIKRASEADELAGTVWRNPAHWLDWKDHIPKGAPVVVYCAYGHELSQAMAACLRALGHDARHLDGGIDEWRKAGHVTQPLTGDSA